MISSNGTKRCSCCEETKTLSAFCSNRAQPDGLNNQCKVCRREAQREWNKRSPRRAFSVSILRALKRSPAVDPADAAHLMAVWERQEGLCALSGIRMTWGRGAPLPTSISLDRINPAAGYEKGNIRLVCHALNCFRGQMTDAEMCDMAAALLVRQGLAGVEGAGCGPVEARTNHLRLAA